MIIESNISRDHIALEAMKTILEKSIEMSKGILGFGVSDIDLPDEKKVAEYAYDYADAMIAERRRRIKLEEEG